MPPVGEAAVVVLQPLQACDVALHGRFHLLGRGQAVGLEGGQHVAQGGDGQDARGELLGAFKGVGDQVEHGVGQGLQGGGGGGDLQPAELREDALGGHHRLGHGALVDHAVGGEGFGGGRGVDRQLDGGRVGIARRQKRRRSGSGPCRPSRRQPGSALPPGRGRAR